MNPTTTLASLVARFGQLPDFRMRLFAMPALEFFGRPNVEQSLPQSLDGGENYLPDRPLMRDLLGPDPFAVFMPIYLHQVRDLLGRVLAQHEREVELDGPEQVIVSRLPDAEQRMLGEIRLDWSRARVPQIETYFERFHQNAQAAVRGAGLTILDADFANKMRVYVSSSAEGRHDADGPALERNSDQLGVATSSLIVVDTRHRLSIYAKTADRIRFEMRRLSRGRYSTLPVSDAIASASATDATLLHIILGVARHDARRLIRWEEVFATFDEQDVIGIADFMRFIIELAGAVDGSVDDLRLLLRQLVVDGGITDDGGASSALIRRLRRSGVLRESRIRSRLPASQYRRYSLTDDYGWVRASLLAAFSSSD